MRSRQGTVPAGCPAQHQESSSDKEASIERYRRMEEAAQVEIARLRQMQTSQAQSRSGSQSVHGYGASSQPDGLDVIQDALAPISQEMEAVEERIVSATREWAAMTQTQLAAEKKRGDSAVAAFHQSQAQVVEQRERADHAEALLKETQRRLREAEEETNRVSAAFHHIKSQLTEAREWAASATAELERRLPRRHFEQSVELLTTSRASRKWYMAKRPPGYISPGARRAGEYQVPGVDLFPQPQPQLHEQPLAEHHRQAFAHDLPHRQYQAAEQRFKHQRAPQHRPSAPQQPSLDAALSRVSDPEGRQPTHLTSGALNGHDERGGYSHRFAPQHENYVSDVSVAAAPHSPNPHHGLPQSEDSHVCAMQHGHGHRRGQAQSPPQTDGTCVLS